MIKHTLYALAVISLTSCAVIIEKPHKQSNNTPETPTSAVVSPATPTTQACIGNTQPPASVAAYLTPATNDALLQQALGMPTKGGLCAGQVYEVTQSFTIYRAWNSTNPGSEKGNWWAFSQPEGSTAKYREDYEICYQWSPIDMMTQCKIEAGTQVVIGPGQSAFCSQYLTYPTSAAKQIFMTDAASATTNCNTFQGVFQWQPQN
ncbi:hypothetical protein [Alteromonas sp. a30]|uniref:hypothetical protein n=1 Tax=Alteromonas sp. a30 TaxID=2730917 RepID=UPI00227E9A86|nr:hypothetical protein [Alteromonas sp. a30]MCY7294717.1 hypothetical protein [Alteromonas sp. a30]